MPKKSKKQVKKSFLNSLIPDLDESAQLTLWIAFIFIFAVFSYLSLFDLAGVAGGYLGSFMYLLLGKGAVIIPTSLIFLGITLFKLQLNKQMDDRLDARLFWGLGMLLLAFNGFLAMFFGDGNLDNVSDSGGVIGHYIYPMFLKEMVGSIAGFLVLTFTLLAGFFLISGVTFVELFLVLKKVFKNPKEALSLAPGLFKIKKKVDITKPQKNERKQPIFTSAAMKANEEEIRTKEAKEAEKPPSKVTTKAIQLGGKTATDTDIKMKKPSADFDWSLPPFDLLEESKNVELNEDVEAKSQAIKDTLQSFGIEVEMADAYVGPTVTQYTLKPAVGVRLSTIDKLSKDLALAMAAKSIRIQAPIPGKSLVGIEIPNDSKSAVRLRDLVQTHDFFNFKDDLPVAIGKDVAGKNIIYSLAKMPHLLVAGATGAGKSVWINAMLLSLLYRYAPGEMQLILMDMKRVELKLYDNIPHLLSPVITDSEKAINALKWAVIEMDNRYKLLEDVGKRNIVDFNKHAVDSEDEDSLPYIVIVIDELADLMMLAKSEVEPMIVRLAQMSRAVGIHLVLGTQRPDTSVITGLIKGNIPTRIAFTVASGVDSRVILDSIGAENLLGQGDALMVSPSSLYPVRFQGPFVEEGEVKRCIKFLRQQIAGREDEVSNIKSEVVEAPKQAINVPGMISNSDGTKNSYTAADETYDQAVGMAVKYQKASASFLQQTMGIGYPKAARLVLQMEENGIVGPLNGSKPRDVYVTEEELANQKIEDQEAAKNSE